MTLRIYSEPAVRSLDEASKRQVSVENLKDSYNERLVKLVPGEAVVAYPLFLAAANQGGGSPDTKIAVLSWLILLIVIALRWSATRAPQGPAQWPAIIIAAISFVIWVYVLKGDFGLKFIFGSLPDVQGFYSSLVLFAWTTLAPLIYRGDPA